MSWNVGVGGGGLQGLLGKLPPSLRELHVQACQLTAADAHQLGGQGILKGIFRDAALFPSGSL